MKKRLDHDQQTQSNSDLLQLNSSLQAQCKSLAVLMKSPTCGDLAAIKKAITELLSGLKSIVPMAHDHDFAQSIQEMMAPLQVANNILADDVVNKAVLHWLRRWYAQCSWDLNKPLDDIDRRNQSAKAQVKTQPWIERIDLLSSNLGDMGLTIKSIKAPTLEHLVLLKQIDGVQTLIAALMEQGKLITSTMSPSLLRLDETIGEFVGSINALISRLRFRGSRVNAISAVTTLRHLTADDEAERMNSLSTALGDFMAECGLLVLAEEKDFYKDNNFSRDSISTVSLSSDEEEFKESKVSLAKTATILMYDSSCEVFHKLVKSNPDFRTMAQLAIPGGVAAFRNIELDEIDELLFNLKEEVCDKRCAISKSSKNSLLAKLDASRDALKSGETVTIDLAELFGSINSLLPGQSHEQSASHCLHRFFTAEGKAYQSIEDKLKSELTDPGRRDSVGYQRVGYSVELILANIALLRSRLQQFSQQPDVKSAERVVTQMGEIEYDIVRESLSLTAYKILCLYFAAVSKEFSAQSVAIETVLSQSEVIGRQHTIKQDRHRLHSLQQEYAGIRGMGRCLTTRSSTVNDFMLLSEASLRGYRRAHGKQQAEKRLVSKLDQAEVRFSKNERDISLSARQAFTHYRGMFDHCFTRRVMLREVVKYEREIGALRLK